jgi:PAS domain S-box-containing protein
MLRRPGTVDQSRPDDFYQQLLERWPEAVLVFDSEQQRYVFVNDAATRLTGYCRDEIMRLQPADLTAPEHAREIPGVVEILERNGEHRRSWRVLRKDGSMVETEITLTRQRVGNRVVSQGLLRIVESLGSAAPRQNGHSTVARERLLEGTGQAVVVLDPAGVVVEWNAAAEALFGWPATDAIGKHVTALAPEGGPRDEVTAILARLQRGELLAGQIPAYRRSGEQVRRTATISPIRGENGAVVGYISVSVPADAGPSSGIRMRRARVRCVACGREVAGTMRRKYCSEKCRQWAYYHRHIDAQRARSRERHDRQRLGLEVNAGSANDSPGPEAGRGPARTTNQTDDETRGVRDDQPD